MSIAKSGLKSPKQLISILCTTLLFGGVFYSSVSFSQETGAIALEEITVFARKREESLQDVPVAITALDADAIERFHADTISEFEKIVPNVDFSDIPFAGQALGAVIRGIGFSDLEKSFEPAVGVSIDGVFLANSTGAAIDAFDLEQVEILRGPQGTLFGRNTVGGVINLQRTKPTEDAGLKLGTRFGNNGVQEFLLVANTGQIGDVLSSKFYVFDKESETYATNILTGSPDDQTDITSYGASFLYQPNDRLKAQLSIDVFDDESQGPPIYNLTQPGEVFCDTPNFLTFIGVFAPQTFNAGCASTSFDIAEASDFEDYVRAEPFLTFFDGSAVTAQVDYEISDTLAFTSITGFREADELLLEENLGGPNLFVNVAPGITIDFPILYQNRVQESEQFSQEFRLAGEIGDNLTFVAGLYYLDAEYTLTGGEYPDGGFGLSQAFGAIGSDEVYNQKTEAIAVFVDGTFQINDRLSLSGGLRYSDETKDASKRFILSTVPGVAGTSRSDSVSFDNTTGRLILQYEFSDDVSVYGGYSRGFRSGGFNGRAASVTALGPFDSETVDSVEAGLRAEFFDGRLRFNPTIFYSEYTDKQEENLIAVPGGAPGATETTVQNASEVEISGLELELLALVSQRFTVRAALGLLDAEFSQFLVPANPADPTDTSVIDVSDSRNLRSGADTTFYIGASYAHPLSNGNAQLVFNASYNYQDELTTSSATDPLGLGRDRIDGPEGFDFSLTYETLNEGTNFKITAYINDAFDDAAGRNATNIVIPGLFTFSTGAPTKVYGIEASVEF